MPATPPAAAPAAAHDPAPDAHTDVGRLDGVLVVGVLLILAGVIFGLFVRPPTAPVLAIISGMVSGLTGTVIGGYAGFRWGASVVARKGVAR